MTPFPAVNQPRTILFWFDSRANPDASMILAYGTNNIAASCAVDIWNDRLALDTYGQGSAVGFAFDNVHRKVVVVLHADSSVSWFIDGTKHGPVGMTMPITVLNGTFSIGARLGQYILQTGTVRNVGIWATDLSDANALALSSNSSPAYNSNGTTNCVGFWHLNSDLLDSSGNGNTLAGRNDSGPVSVTPSAGVTFDGSFWLQGSDGYDSGLAIPDIDILSNSYGQAGDTITANGTNFNNLVLAFWGVQYPPTLASYTVLSDISMTFTVPALEAGVTSLRFFNAAGHSSYRNFTVVAPPVVPTDVSLSAGWDTGSLAPYVILNWSDTNNGTCDYRVEYTTDGDWATFTSINVDYSNYGTNLAVLDLLPAVTYYVRVCAVNSLGTSDFAYPDPVAIMTPATSPVSPRRLRLLRGA